MITFNSDQLRLVSDITLSAGAVSVIIGCSKITIYRLRRKLGICVVVGVKPGSPSKSKKERVEVKCHNCGNSYYVLPKRSDETKYCSKKCQ